MLQLVLFFLFFLIVSGLRLLYQYEKGVVFTLGRYQGIKEPGLRWIIPVIQTMEKLDLRIRTVDIPKQEMITKDNITVNLNAVVYFRVDKPKDAIIEIKDYAFAVGQYTQAALRDVIGNNELDSVLTERVKIATNIKEIVDSETARWGVDIEAIKIQEIELAPEMKRAMAKQAEAERGRRAMIISSEGELKASENLSKAAASLSKNPASLHLRTLQTLRDIASDPAQKIVLFLPSDLANIAEVLKSK